MSRGGIEPARVPDLIARKRDGGELSRDEISRLIASYTKDETPDYQMSAFAMAVFFRGMTAEETVALTEAMRDSGKVVDLSAIPGPKVDKHSTGGVGDKVSICLAPIVAAAGVRVPMVSGRGLGHTGGTLDKLEAIPGFTVDQSLRRYRSLVRRYGMALLGQTADIAPADKRLYALRDVTGTVESIPLITASILSKKLAEGIDALVLDCKVGKGAFMRTQKEAEALARSIVEVGRRAGTPVSALLTAMDEPLGHAVGNALETREALEVLHGGGPEDLVAITIRLGAEMLRLGGVARGRAAEQRLKQAIRDRSALQTMVRLTKAQGGDPRVVYEPDRLPKAPHRHLVRASAGGFVREINAKCIGLAAMRLGAGRATVEDAIDPAVGIVLKAKVGDRVDKGAPIAELHLRRASQAAQGAREVGEAFRFGRTRKAPGPLVVGTIRS